MATTISVSFTVNENALERHLDNVVQGIVAKYIREKLNEFTERITAEVGKPAAEGAYGTSAVQLWLEKIPRGFKLVANGEAVGFLEFGAGTMADKNHPFADEAPFEVAPGSWSQSYGSGQFIPYRHESWVFGGRVYRYVIPRRGLYEAHKAMQNDIIRVAKEVFSE